MSSQRPADPRASGAAGATGTLAAPRWAWWAGAGIAAAAAASLLGRLAFGVDLTDEAYYLAVPWRFVHGARPFVDEAGVQQTASLLTTPFVKLYALLVPGGDGIVLAFRFLFAIALGLVVWSAFAYLKRRLPWPVALVVSCVTLAWVPYCIPALSYNTIGIGALTVGSFIGLGAIEDSSGRRLGLAGLLHGIACVAYPTLAVPVVVFGVAAWFFVGAGKRRPLAWWAAAIALVGAALGAYLLFVGVKNIESTLAYTESFGLSVGGIQRSRLIWRGLAVTATPLRPLFVVVALGGAAVYAKWPKVGAALLLAAPLSALAFSQSDSWSLQSFYLLAVTIAVAAAVVLGAWTRPEARGLAFVVFLPGVVAGLTLGYTSTNLSHQIGLGMLGAVVAGLAVVAMLVLAVPGRVWAPALFLMLAGVIATMSVMLWSCMYRDGPLETLTAVVPSGPYAGLRTTPAQSALVVGLESDIRGALKPGGKLLVYDALPGAYLMAPVAGSALNTYQFSPAHYPQARRDHPLAYIRDNGMPDVVVRSYAFEPVAKDDPLDALLLRSPYRLVVDRGLYAVWAR